MIKEWMAQKKAKQQLQKAFRMGEMGVTYSYGDTSGKVYPKIHAVTVRPDSTEYVFTLPTGMDPKLITKQEYCFKQVFGERIEIKGNIKKFTLTVYTASLPDVIHYNLEQYREHMKNKELPIVCGIDRQGKRIVYDMLEYPHLLIAGETGSGKSTQLRSILTSIIQTSSPDRLQLFLGDLKRSEFHLFRNVEHVKAVAVSIAELNPILKHIQDELIRRGDLLDSYELSHIKDLPDPPPYILLCIDEVAMLQQEKKIMRIIEDISAIGRALGIFLTLSMQRPDRDVLNGKLKNNLTVRMGFKCADLINSRIIGTPGAEKLKEKGRMLLKLDGLDDLKEIQSPYLDIEGAKKLLEGYKSSKPKNVSKGSKTTNNEESDILDTVFEVLD